MASAVHLKSRTGCPCSAGPEAESIMSTTLSRPSLPILAGPIPPVEPLPFITYLRTVRRNLIEALDETMYRKPIIRQRSAFSPSFIVSAPAGLRRVLLDNAANYPKAPVEHRILGPAMGNGLILSEGDTWRAHRRIMAPAFDHRTNETYAPVMVDAALRLATRWQALPASATVEVSHDMMELTLDIISRSMFAADSDSIVGIIREGSDRYQDAMMVGLAEFIPGIGRLWSAIKGARGRAIMREFDRAMFALIEKRRHTPSAHHDLLDRLITSRDEVSGATMTAREVRDQVLTIFVAGHETTALALMWTWYLLSMHPEHEARMHAELDAVLGGRRPAWSDIPSLPYTRMILQESMRLYPPVHTLAFRQAAEADVVCGMTVPKGSLVTMIPWIIHRHRDHWTDPGRFDPERFTPEAIAQRDRLAYIPFGFGPRVCIGASFAMTEAVLILATLAQRVRLRVAPGCPVEPHALFTLRARHGMHMEVTRRAV
jgi:cytochrome P450